MPILSFNERVDIAVRIVIELYPETRLYEATGVASGGLTTDPSMINQLRAVFYNENNTTVAIEETDCGEFGTPEVLQYLWLGDSIIEWPIGMDLPKANDLKESAGYRDSYAAVTLRNPLGPTKSNPYFVFAGNPTQSKVLVDTITGDVYPAR